MKDSVTKFDLEAAFKALDSLSIPVPQKGIKANRVDLTETLSKKSKFDVLFEDYYNVADSTDLATAKEAREAEIAKAKLSRIEKIVDLNADSPDDLLTSYVGKYIIQCPQCMTLFYKDAEDVEESDDDPTTVNVAETCQHCGNASGYTLIGKVGAVDPESLSIPEETSEETPEETPEETEQEPDLTDTQETDEDAQDKGAEITAEEAPEEEDSTDEADFDSLAALEDDDNEKDNHMESLKNLPASNLNEGIQGAEPSADDFKDLISSAEFKKPISDTAVRAMLQNMGEDYKSADSESDIRLAIKKTLDDLQYQYGEEDIDAIIEQLSVSNILNPTKDDIAIAIAVYFSDDNILEEGIVDNWAAKLVDAFTKKFKSRDSKADWILENAAKDYNKTVVDKQGKTTLEKTNRQFNTFLVLGFTDTFDDGRRIVSAPDFTCTNLVLGTAPQVRETFAEADAVAKGWSMQQKNGPAFIFFAEGKEDNKPAFCCEYFEGNLINDQIEKYFDLVKKSLKGAKLMSKGSKDEDNTTEPTESNDTDSKADSESVEDTNESISLTDFISNLESIDESSLQAKLSEYLIEKYSTFAHFKITSCEYLNEQLVVLGNLYDTLGNKIKTSFKFVECCKDSQTENSFISLNESLAGNKKFKIVGQVKNKTFITTNLAIC